jgi:hypothetical protein
MRKCGVLDDPVARLEVPPDVEIEDRKFELKGDSSHKHEKRRQHEQLQPAQARQWNQLFQEVQIASS